MTSRRLMEDFNDLLNCNTEDLGIAVLDTDDLTRITAFIKGPEGTPYEGGKFRLNLCVPQSYPLEPPIVSFTTPVWHPNISSATGFICLNVLSRDWHGTMNLRGVILSVQNLLANPVAEDAQDYVVGVQATRNPAIFENVAQMWTHVYAHGKKRDDGYYFILKEHMEARGVSQETAVRELAASDWGLHDEELV